VGAGEIIATVIALTALGITAWQGIVSRRRFQQEDRRLERLGTAELVLEHFSVNSDQLRVSLIARNKGPGPAYAPYVLLVEDDGTPTPNMGEVGFIAVGDSALLSAGLGSPAKGPVQVWLVWEDVRGEQERDTGHRA